jgi:hypothetical protein
MYAGDVRVQCLNKPTDSNSPFSLDTAGTEQFSKLAPIDLSHVVITDMNSAAMR